MGVSHPHPALRTLAALLSFLLVLGPGASALAAPARATLVVLPEVTLPGASDAFAAKVLSQILNELRQRTELKLVDAPTNRAAQDSGAKEKADAEKARAAAQQALDKAGDLSLKGKAKQAAQQLQKGIAQLTAQPLALDEAGGKLLGDMLLQLAVTRSMAGDEDGSDAALAELVRRAPDRTLAAGSFPPAFLRSFDVSRQRGLSGPRASIRVFAPAGITGARVFLDGRPLGNAPILLADALAGAHAVRVESGEQAWAEAVKADAGAQLSVVPQLGESSANQLAGSLAQGKIDRETATRLARIAKAAGAQAALVGTVSREGDGYTVRSALIFVRGERAVPLATLALDAEMLSGSLEVLRLADDLVTKLTNPPPAALLPLAMGGSATEAEMPSVVAAPAAAETALALPAASDLAAAAGTEKKPPEKSVELALPLPLPIETPAPNSANPPPAQASDVPPAPVAEPAPNQTASRMPVIPGAPPPAAPAPVASAPVAPSAPAVVERAPVIPNAPGSADRAPVIPNAPATADRVPVIPGAPAPAAAAATPPPPKPAPLAGSLDAATAGLNNPGATPPAETPASPGDRQVLVPGAKPPPLPLPLPIAPPPSPAETPAPASDAQLATAAPKKIEEPAPSKNLFVPRKPTERDDDDQQVAVATTATPPAPAAATQIQALEANEIATVHEEPAKKNHTVLWIVAGALVVGAAAVGGVVLYANSRTASSSNVSLSWSH